MPSDFEAQFVTTQSVEHGTCCCLMCPHLAGDCALCPPLQVQIPDFTLECFNPDEDSGPCSVFTAPLTPLDTVFHPALNCHTSGCVFPPVPPSMVNSFCRWCTPIPGETGLFYFAQLACGLGQTFGGIGIPPIPRWIVSLLFGHSTLKGPFICNTISMVVWISDARPTGFPGTDGAHCPALGEYNYWYSQRLSTFGCNVGGCLTQLIEPVDPALVMLQ